MNDFKEEKFIEKFIDMDLSVPYPIGEQYSIKNFIVRKMKVVDSCCNILLQNIVLSYLVRRLTFY